MDASYGLTRYLFILKATFLSSSSSVSLLRGEAELDLCAFFTNNHDLWIDLKLITAFQLHFGAHLRLRIATMACCDWIEGVRYKIGWD